MKYDTAIVFGNGAFGTAIASVLSHNFKKVIMKVRSKDVYDCLKEGENKVYLPGHRLSTNMVPALNWQEVDAEVEGRVELLVSGIPTTVIKDYCQEHGTQLEKYLNQNIPLVSLAKGIDSDTLELVDDLFYAKFREWRDQFIYLSGPSFAQEIISKHVTCVSVAGRSTVLLKLVANMLDTSFFKVFMTYDVKGLLLGGALKNVLAIGAGIIEGLGYNHNTRAAMVTRGIYEMLRFGLVFNARPETFYGLSGMGDLILTTTGTMSRNKSFGLEIAKGRSAQEILKSQRTVVEGYKTTKAIYHLAEKYSIRCRSFISVYEVLYNGRDPREVITELMRRVPSFEI